MAPCHARPPLEGAADASKLKLLAEAGSLDECGPVISRIESRPARTGPHRSRGAAHECRLLAGRSILHSVYFALNQEIQRCAFIKDYVRVVEASSSPLYVRADLHQRYARCEQAR